MEFKQACRASYDGMFFEDVGVAKPSGSETVCTKKVTARPRGQQFVESHVCVCNKDNCNTVEILKAFLNSGTQI